MSLVSTLFSIRILFSSLMYFANLKEYCSQNLTKNILCRGILVTFADGQIVFQRKKKKTIATRSEKTSELTSIYGRTAKQCKSKKNNETMAGNAR